MNNKPTGNLEELFRHHLAEAEVPPRSMLWEQIDNSLLVAQNETYRRRLVATRWVAAASLLLATLAGTGWWAQHEAGTADRLAANRIDRNANTKTGARRGAEAAGQHQVGLNQQGSFDSATGAGSVAKISNKASGTSMKPGAASLATGSNPAKTSKLPGIELAATSAGLASSPVGLSAAALPYRSAAGASSYAAGASRSGAATTGRLALGRPVKFTSDLNSTADYAAVAVASVRTTDAAQAVAAADAARGGRLPGVPALAEVASLDWLDSRPVALQNHLSTASLPAGLAALALPADAKTTVVPPVRKWQFGVSYAATAFNPNINFSRSGGDADFDYNPALGTNSPALTEAAAAEYRAHLQNGIGQRLALRATRQLGGHWALSTGLEVTQQSATSATSAAFLGEQVPDFGQQRSTELRSTSFRYRTAGIPVELRYSNPMKRGWSGYGRVGAVVSALLGVRGEVEGQPEATRLYSLRSSNDAYRNALTTVRGGAGVQFRPAAGRWAFTLGPTAEVGLLSLNAHPAQDFLHQSRPYGFGLEAGVEFGK